VRINLPGCSVSKHAPTGASDPRSSRRAAAPGMTPRLRSGAASVQLACQGCRRILDVVDSTPLSSSSVRARGCTSGIRWHNSSKGSRGSEQDLALPLRLAVHCGRASSRRPIVGIAFDLFATPRVASRTPDPSAASSSLFAYALTIRLIAENADHVITYRCRPVLFSRFP